ncbi:MAG: hypothetical protein WBP85_02285, partial [Terracidiphilus sp.]
NTGGFGTGNLAKDTGITSALTSQTYFGTDEGNIFEPNSSAPGLPTLPVLTCNPSKNLGTHQILNGSCFTAPALKFNAGGVAAGTSAPAQSSNGGFAYPYMRMTSYFDNDLAIYRTFHVHEQQNVQFRASAFDWLNHSLLTFAGGNYYTLNYNVNYATQAITPNYSTSGANAFGLMTVRSALPYARVIELDLKYAF